MRNLPHPKGKEEEEFLRRDYDFCSRAQYKGSLNTIHWYIREGREFKPYPAHSSDWYLPVAVIKLNKIKEDRYLIDHGLVCRYRWAIREGFNHSLDPNLRNRYDEPRHRNTIKGVLGYIEMIEKRSEEEMREIRNHN